jgi:hypothetical protein
VAKICLKTVERVQLNFRHDSDRKSTKLAEIRPIVGFFCPDLGEIRPVWKNFGQFGKISANLNDIRPKSVAEIQLRRF